MKIVTFACDLYADIAPAWWHLFKTRWPGCAYGVEFVTNHQKLNVPVPVHYLDDRPDIAFGWRLRQFIRQHYTDEHMLLTMVDYLIKRVDAPLIAEAHQLCALPSVRHVRLRPMPPPQFPYPAEGFGRIDKRVRYSLSLQPGIWETQVLYDLCRDSWDPWQVEVRGSRLVQHVAGEFLSTKRPAIPHHNYYHKRSAQGVEWVKARVPREAWPKAARKEKA